jgi:hypothetical protein
VYGFQELCRHLASIGRTQPLKKSADFLSGSIIQISGLPLANGLNDPSGSRSVVNLSALLLDEDNGVCRLQILGPISRARGIWVSAPRNRDSVGRVDTVCLDQFRV